MTRIRKAAIAVLCGITICSVAACSQQPAPSSSEQRQPAITPPVAPTSFAIPGMEKYTDSEFGFSFWYPANWKITLEPPENTGWFQGGEVVKHIEAAGADHFGVTIDEFLSTSNSITELGHTMSASPVGVDQKYSYDSKTNRWIYETLSPVEGGGGIVAPTPADVSNLTMSGLPVFFGAARHGANTIVPLSATKFLVITTNDPGGTPDQRYLARTVVASDSSAATPVASTQQEETVRAEAVVYTGTAIEDGFWFKDDRYVYDAHGRILEEADAATFHAIGHSGYAMDAKNVFVEGTRISNADPQTFKILDSGISKDKDHVFKDAKTIPIADAPTFVHVGPGPTFKDKNHSYDWRDGNLKLDRKAAP